MRTLLRCRRSIPLYTPRLLWKTSYSQANELFILGALINSLNSWNIHFMLTWIENIVFEEFCTLAVSAELLMYQMTSDNNTDVIMHVFQHGLLHAQHAAFRQLETAHRMLIYRYLYRVQSVAGDVLINLQTDRQTDALHIVVNLSPSPENICGRCLWITVLYGIQTAKWHIFAYKKIF